MIKRTAFLLPRVVGLIRVGQQSMIDNFRAQTAAIYWRDWQWNVCGDATDIFLFLAVCSVHRIRIITLVAEQW